MSRRPIPTLLFAAALLALLAFASTADAQVQPWLEDRRYTEGRGIEVGDFELHPGVAAEFGYDTNYFHAADDEDPVGALRLRITPSFSVGTLTGRRRGEDAAPPMVAFRAGIYATYDEFIAVSGSDAGKERMNDNRNISGRVDFNVDFAPGRVVFGSVHGGLTRTIEANDIGTAGDFRRLLPDGGAEIGFAPGGGMFDWRFGYNFHGTFFEVGSLADRLNNYNHEITTRGRWRFLPRSALTFDGRFSFIDYPNEGTKTDSHPMRARLGYNGLITNSFAILLLGGWGASFYSDDATANPRDFDSFIGQAEVKWLITPSPSTDPQAASLSLSSLAAGFTRDFADSFIGTFEEIDRGYVKFSYLFAGRFLLVIDGGVAAVIFPAIPDLGINDGFTAIRVDASAFGEYRFTDYFGLNATVRYDTNITDQRIAGGAGAPSENLQWQQFQAYIGARFLW